MNIIACWSPVHGLGRVTVNTGLLASYMALAKKKTVLALDGHRNHGRFQEIFCPQETGQSPQLFTYACTHNLTTNQLKMHTDSLIEKSLYFLQLNSQVRYNHDFIAAFPGILECTRDCYDYTFVDTYPETEDEITGMVLKHADQVLVCLPQEDSIIQQFVKRKKGYWHPELENKQYHCVISGYRKDYEHYTLRSIQRKYRIKELFSIPDNRYVHKAIMENKFLRWVVSNYDVNRKDPGYQLFECLAALTDRVMDTPGRKGLFSQLSGRILENSKEHIGGSSIW